MKSPGVAATICFMVLSISAHGQLVLSAGPNAYAGASGVMVGGGAEVEDWLSLSTDRASEGLMIGGGVEYVYLTTAVTKTPGAGWILPFTIKYGFLAGKNLVVGFGAGAALVIADVDQEDYFGGYYTTSSVGGAPFAEARAYLYVSPHISLQLVARAGALFSDSGTLPFLGARLLVGYYLELPRAAAQPDVDVPDDDEDF